MVESLCELLKDDEEYSSSVLDGAAMLNGTFKPHIADSIKQVGICCSE